MIGEAMGRDITRGQVLRGGTDGHFLAIGPVIGACLRVAEALAEEGLSVGVADARSVKPLDVDLLDRISTCAIITVEENSIEG